MTKPTGPYSGPVVTRAEAKATGAKFYFTGTACKNGHIDRRYAAHKNCCACNVMKQAALRARDPAATLAKHKALWLVTKDDTEYQAYRIAYRLKNGDKLRATAAKWCIENPERRRQIQMNRYARLKGSEGSHTADEVRHLLKVQRGKCAYCRCSIKSGYHEDHIKALSKGGSNFISNIQLLCPPCNHRKSAKDAVSFARQIGLLI